MFFSLKRRFGGWAVTSTSGKKACDRASPYPKKQNDE
jgi:hypothetical protein